MIKKLNTKTICLQTTFLLLCTQLSAQQTETKSADFLKNSSQSFARLMADRLACPINNEQQNVLQAHLLQDYYLDTLTTDFIKFCSLDLDKNHDLISETGEVNQVLYDQQNKDFENNFLLRYLNRSEQEAHTTLKNYAKILSKSVIDVRVHARRMYFKGWTCLPTDSTVALIHTRLNVPTAELSLSSSSAPSTEAACETIKSENINLWSKQEYSPEGTFHNVASLEHKQEEESRSSVPSDTLSKVSFTFQLTLNDDDSPRNEKIRNRVTTEHMLFWNECGENPNSIIGRYFEKKRDTAKSAEWPQSGISDCRPARKMSKAFIDYLNANLGRCAAMATFPEARKEIRSVLQKYTRKTNPDAVDMAVIKSVKTINNKYSFNINAIFEKIKSIHILHQGVQGDSNHKNTSNHAMNVLRAIDVSHIKLNFNDGSESIFEHGVAGYVEDLYRNRKIKNATDEQKLQSDFWATFNACMSERGGGTISKTLSHTKVGLNHTGHTHIALPYPDKIRGPYNSKFEDSFHEDQLVLE